MQIDQVVCTGCGECVPYCPVGAIKEVDGAVSIEFDECVECDCCLYFANCPVNAIQESPETDQWPRVIRRQFSSPVTAHPSTGTFGRGTEEMKTNDVTGRFKPGEIGIAMEFGRPGIAARLSDLEKMTGALAKAGIPMEQQNPVFLLIDNPATGEMKPDVRNERVLSAILEVRTTPARLPEVVAIIKGVAGQLDTVVSWEMITRLNDDGSIPILEDLKKLGISPRPNAKINLGVGRPRAED